MNPKCKVRALIYFDESAEGCPSWESICEAFATRPLSMLDAFNANRDHVPDSICGIGWIYARNILSYRDYPAKQLKRSIYWNFEEETCPISEIENISEEENVSTKKCITDGSTYCRFIRLHDYFGWHPINFETNTQEHPQLIEDIEVPIAIGTHFLFNSIFKDDAKSTRKAAMQWYLSKIPENAKILMICESTSPVSHKMHLHVPHCNTVSGDWNASCDNYEGNIPNIVHAMKREIEEEVGISCCNNSIVVDVTRQHAKNISDFNSESKQNEEENYVSDYLFLVNLNESFGFIDSNLSMPRMTPLNFLSTYS
jgi:hypothetical protein